MQPPPVDVSRPTYYDPSEPYRALLRPPDSQNSADARHPSATNIDPRTGVIKRIPQFYYSPYDENSRPPVQPNVVDPREINPNLQPPYGVGQPAPYPQPIPITMDPYMAEQYPYSTPYLIPVTENVPLNEPAPIYHDQTKVDVLAAHQKDADLSRLEVYHFTPKHEGIPSAAARAQPIIQYHVYPYPPGAAQLPPMPSPQQQFLPYPQPWQNYPRNFPPYVPEPPPSLQFLAETKARGSQTEPPSTKNRGVSPMYFPPPAPIYDEDGYPYIHHREMHTDRYRLPTGRIDRRFYNSNAPTPVVDCRCLECQQERSKVINYYPD